MYQGVLHFGVPAIVILTARYVIGVLPDAFLAIGVVMSFALLASGFILFWWRGFKSQRASSSSR